MSSSPVDTQRRHPLLAFTGRLHQVLDQLGEPATWTLSDDEVAARGHRAGRGGAAAAGAPAAAAGRGGPLRPRRPDRRGQHRGLAARADPDRRTRGLPAGEAGPWVGGARRDPGGAARRRGPARPGRRGHHRRRGAPGRGPRHRATPPSSTSSPRPPSHDAKTLRVLGKHLLEVVAPDRADELIARRLEREEAEARRTASLTTWEDGHGSLCGRFTIPVLHGAMLTKAPGRAGQPRPPQPDPARGRRVPTGVRAGVLRAAGALPTKRLPKHAGVNATVIVTMTLDTLEGRLQAGGILGTGHQLSPARSAGWPARPGSSPSSWAAAPRSSTWPPRAATTPNRSASRWHWTRAAGATSPAATAPASTPTTAKPGPKAAKPPRTSSAGGTTPSSTKATTTPDGRDPLRSVSASRRRRSGMTASR